MKLHTFCLGKMQNSEMYRRGFIVPLNEKAERAIRSNNVDNTTAVDSYELPNDEVFESLWEKKLFKLINEELGTMIDDYEEERIDKEDISSLKKAVISFENTNNFEFLEREVIAELKRLCDVAIKNNSSFFFIL